MNTYLFGVEMSLESFQKLGDEIFSSQGSKLLMLYQFDSIFSNV